MSRSRDGLARRIAAALLPERWSDSVLGDLEEERGHRRSQGRPAGPAWLVAAALAVAIRLRWRRVLDRRERAPVRRRGLRELVAADLRQAFRSLRRRRGFATAAVLTLALGVGANVAVATLGWHLLLAPLPWPRADRLVNVWNTTLPSGAINTLAPANFLDFERESRAFAAIAAYTYFDYPLNLTGAGEPVEVRIRAVTGSYFRVFDVPPAAGRVLGPDDALHDRRVALLSDGLWQRHFDRDPGIVGRRVLLDDVLFEVVGVMPAGFDPGARPPDAWVPYSMTPELRDMRLGYFLGAVGRLRPEVTVEQASADLGAVARRAAERFPASNGKIGATARGLQDELVATVRPGLLLLGAASALVLAIACANLAGLQLARSGALARELAVRGVLGATRGQLVRMVLVEGLLVASIAGIVGLVIGWSGVRVVAALAPPSLAQATRLPFDPWIAGYAVLVSLLAGALLSWAPAWRVTRPAPAEALRARTASAGGGTRLRSSLVTTEVALATTLLVSALLLLTSLVNVLRVDLGFDPEGVVVADLRVPASRYEDLGRKNRFFEDLSARVAAAPGVRAVCATNAVPLEHAINMTYVPEGTESPLVALPVTVTPGCFATLRVPLRAGRVFAAHEAEPVAVVSEGFARRAFPGQEAVGRTLRVGLASGELLTVVGVVAESRRRTVDAATLPQIYRPAQQDADFPVARLMFRADGDPAAAVDALRVAVRELDRAQPVGEVRRLEDVVARATGGRRFLLWVLGVFAAVAALLAGVGIYGLLAQGIALRRGEIGVRVALGAAPRRIARLVSGGALATVVVGVGIGLLAAWVGSSVLARFAFGVSASEPALYAAAAALLLLVAAVAAYVPVRRAVRVDPMLVLRAE